MGKHFPVAVAPPARPTPGAPPARRGYGHPWLTLLAVAFGIMMVGLDGTVVAIANPAIARDLSANLASLQWVTNGYLLALAVSLIIAGRLADRFGRKGVFLTGVIGFAAASVLVGLSGSIGLVVFWRVVQGLAGAMLQPASLAIVRSTFTPERLDVALGIWGGASALAVASGPIVGGLLVEHVSWRWVFYLNAPVALATALLGGWVIRPSRDPGAAVSGARLPPSAPHLFLPAMLAGRRLAEPVARLRATSAPQPVLPALRRRLAEPVARFRARSAPQLLRPAATTRRRLAGSFDLPGVGLLATALSALVWGLIRAQAVGFGTAEPLSYLAVAEALGVAFVLREQHAAHPLLPLRLFRSVPLSAGTVLITLGAFALFGTFFFVTLYLQQVHGLTPVAAGVRLLPMTATFMFSAPLAGALTARLGPRPPLVAGMGLLAAAQLALSRLSVDSPFSGLWPAFVLLGIGLGLVVVAGTEAIVGNAPVALAGVAGGLQQTGFQLGGVLGTTVFSTVMSARVGSVLADRLAGAGVPADLLPGLAGSTGYVGQGAAPVPPGTPAPLAQAITSGAHLAFMDGFRAALVVGTVIALAGAAAALLVHRSSDHAAPDHPGAGHPAPDHADADHPRLTSTAPGGRPG